MAILAVTITLLTGSVLLAHPSGPQDPQGKGTMALRHAVLSREPFKKMPPAAAGTVRAVVYDWNVGSGVATLVAFEDGTTSVYLSTGGGIIGTGSHESVKRAAAAFRNEAARLRSRFTPAEAFPLPESGESRFYLVTDAATLQSAALSEAELKGDGHPLHKLARLGQDVISAVREASPRRK